MDWWCEKRGLQTALSSSMNKRHKNCKYKFFKHSPFKQQLPLKKNLNEFLSSRDVEGKRRNIFKSKGAYRDPQKGSSQDPQRTSNWGHCISYTCKWEHVSSLYIPIGYPHWCYLNVKVPLHHEEPQMQETTSSGMSSSIVPLHQWSQRS